MSDYSTVAQRILRAASNASTQRTLEENRFESLINETRRNFRRSSSGSFSPRGRKKKDTFSRKIFLMKHSRVDFLPSMAEQRYLQTVGLGESKKALVISRGSTIDVIKEDIISLYPIHVQGLLRMSDFRLYKCDRVRKIDLLENVSNAIDLERALGLSRIVVVPKNDFPNDLPVMIESSEDKGVEVDPTPTTSGSPDGSTSATRTDLEAVLITHDSLVNSSVHSNRSSSLQNRSSGSFETLSCPPSPSRMHFGCETDEFTLEEFTFEDLVDNTFHVNDELEPYLSFPRICEESALNFIELSRETILTKMFELYNDNTLTNSRLGVKFTSEDGIDAGGLLTEMFTIFWQKVFESGEFFIGADVVIPYVKLEKLRELRPKFVIIGRILGHMMMLTNTMPPRLALYTLTALSDKTEDYCSTNEQQLLQDFLMYITVPERRLIQKALKQFENFTENETNRFITLYTTYGLANVIPNKKNVLEHILLLAENTIIKNTIELYKKIKEGLPNHIIEFLTNIPTNYATNIWKKLQPTPTKLANVLKLEVVCATNEEDKIFYFLQNYILNLNTHMIERFLLFVTGGVQMPESILVDFHGELGILRRPMASTCSNLLRLGRGYENQSEFNDEMDAFLKSDLIFTYDTY